MEISPNMSLSDSYRQLMAMPSPGQQLIDELKELTGRKEMTVRMWLTGLQMPAAYLRQRIAEHFDIPQDILFPTAPQTTNDNDK